MSRVSSMFLSTETVRQKGPQLDLTIQLGEDVTLWVYRSEVDPTPVGLDGVLVGVHIDVDMITFDVAFEIGSTGVWSVTRNVLGRVTKRGEDFNGQKIELTQSGPPTEAPPPVRRPKLSVITNKDSQLLADEQAAQADQVAAAPEQQPVTVEFAMATETFDWMVINLAPTGLLTHSDEQVFRIQYPNRQEAELAIEVFRALGHEWDDKWKVVPAA